MKLAALDDCLDNGVEVSHADADLVFEVRHDLNDKGKIVETPAHIKLTRNIKFTLALYARAHRIARKLDTASEWWECLVSSIKVRDRLMHPRNPKDLDVSPKEVISAIKAQRGYSSEIIALIKQVDA